ncbi:hypothetical protein MYRNA_17 [Mycobacterium phage Myrna]|uniref:Uncharacterized protein n=1 Tax=Mycobacterium phage Myrna TaxID=546805 RepID=B5LJ28_9CAUD|nr:gp17 [Mycobacterium phage Myrna]ACH62025.1 hypothetical protein MYRNA_17 [Mycobacterium phage Myrna]
MTWAATYIPEWWPPLEGRTGWSIEPQSVATPSGLWVRLPPACHPMSVGSGTGVFMALWCGPDRDRRMGRMTTHEPRRPMAEIESTLTHEGVTYAANIVTIERTTLGREDHGVFLAQLHIDGGGWGTTVGGHVLDDKPATRDGKTDRLGTAFGMQYIIEIISTVVGEYGSWEDVKGKRIFILHEQGTRRFDAAGYNCKGIASLDGKRVMIFDQVVERMRDVVGV